MIADIHKSTKKEFSNHFLSHTHSHPSYEVFFVTERKMWVTTQTETFLCENSLVIIPHGITHYTLTEDALISIIFFNTEKRKDASTVAMYKKFTEAIEKHPVVLPLNADELFLCPKHVTRIIRR